MVFSKRLFILMVFGPGGYDLVVMDITGSTGPHLSSLMWIVEALCGDYATKPPLEMRSWYEYHDRNEKWNGPSQKYGKNPMQEVVVTTYHYRSIRQSSTLILWAY